MITSKCTGKVLHAKTATFKDDSGNDVTYGKIQLLTDDASGQFSSIQNIKVRTENFGWIPDIAAQRGKDVTLNLDQSVYNNKVSFYLASELKKAS